MSNPKSSDEALIFHEFRAKLTSMVGSEGRYLQIDTEEDSPFWMLAYDDVPNTGNTTAFTFGVSSVQHPAWRLGCPELVISVNSREDDWLLSLGAISSILRGKCPFSLGNVLRFGKPLSVNTTMSAYFLFWPTILQKEQTNLKLIDRKINFVQAYPIYESEINLISKEDAEQFFMSDGVDFSDIMRNSTASIFY